MSHQELISKVIEEYKCIAFSSITDFIQINNKNEIKSKLTAIKHPAVAQIDITNTKYGTSIKIKMHDKLTALKFLVQYLGISKSHSNDLDILTSNLEILSPTELKKLINKLKNNV